MQQQRKKQKIVQLPYKNKIQKKESKTIKFDDFRQDKNFSIEIVEVRKFSGQY